MFVFKLSWLPYIFLIGGIALLADGDEAGAVIFLIGLVWTGYTLYKKFGKKNAQSGAAPVQPSAPAQITEPAKPAAPVQAEKTEQPAAPASPMQEEKPLQSAAPAQPAAAAQPATTAPKFCFNCGNKLDAGAVFCSSCGKKVQ